MQTDLVKLFIESEALNQSLHLLAKFAPLWVPFILFSVFYRLWLVYVRAKAIHKSGSVLLEIRIPKEVTKSPAAMEMVFTSLHQKAGSTYHDTFLNGKIRPWFSFELVSIEGKVRFFVWTWPKFKNLLEAQIYAQYPTIEITEVKDDYTKKFEMTSGKYSLFGVQFQSSNEHVFPIKTYIDYGMDKDPKEEFKIEPMSPILEYLGSMRKGQNAMYQIIIQAHRKLSFLDDGYFKWGSFINSEKPDWKELAKAQITKIREEGKVALDEDAETQMKVIHLTKGQTDKITAIERSLDKNPFECVVRGIYICESEKFDGNNISGLLGSFNQYNSNNLNGFKIGFTTDFDYPYLSDPFGTRLVKLKRKILDAYKRRSYFQSPYKYWKSKPFILNTEELATIFHFPGKVVETPSFERISSKKSEAPANLPI
jgi:hypothetical protein